MPALRVLCYNIRSMRDDRAALARVIRSVEPDVVCVQEAPRFLRWRSTCAALARTSGMVIVSGGRPAAANLIMSSLSVDVVSTADVLFSKDPGLHQRGTTIAVLRRSGSTFAIAGTHLDVKPEPRLRHVAELEAAIARHVRAGTAVIVAGDVNDRPGSAVWDAMTVGRIDAEAAGVSSGAGSDVRAAERIDGIFVDPAIAVRSARVIDTPDAHVASDHLPVLAELNLPEVASADDPAR